MGDEERVALRERLAALCHEQWSGWMEYLFEKCDTIIGGDGSPNGALRMPPWAAERWRRQVATPYADLSAAEQDSDRAEADRFLTVFAPLLAERDAALARVAKLEAALLACTDPDPYFEDEYGITCVFCGKARRFGHIPGCAWVAARALLEEGE